MNTALSAVGFAIQSAKDSPATEPSWWHGVAGGKMVSFDPEQKEDELTTGLPAGVGEYRESVACAAGYESRAWPKSIGGLLYAILGAVSTTGTTPKTHVITADSALPYCTVFGKMDTELRSIADAKLDELTLEWEGNGPLKVSAVWAGCDLAYEASITPVATETFDAYFMGAHMTAQTVDLTGDAYSPGSTLGGKMTFKRNLEVDIISGTLTPNDVRDGQLEIELDLKYRVADLLSLRKLLTGTENGSTATATVPYGDFTFTWTISANESVSLAATKVAFQAESPEAEPKGGPVDLALKGKCYMVSGGTPLTATVVNSQASY